MKSKIYFDTEFEGLFDKAKLISIGLTNETGSALFYAELSDNYKLENCSDFCKTVVIPLLQNDKSVMTYTQLKNNLWIWLENQGPNTVLICDCKRDVTQIKKLFPLGLPKNSTYKVLNFYSRWKRRIINFNRRIYKTHNLRDHHALDDAIANRIIFEGK